MQLNESQRYALVSIAKSQGFQVILDIMEDECKKVETKLLSAPEGDDAEVLAAHKMAKASWSFMAKVEKRIAFEMQEVFNQEPQKTNSDEQEILNAVGLTGENNVQERN